MDRPTQTDPLALTVRDALRVVPIGRTALYEALRRGDIPSVRIGGRVLIPRAALLRMFDGASDPRPPARTTP